MYRKLLVALDRSTTRSLVLEKIAGLAPALGAEVMLVHVLSAYDNDSPGLPVRAYHSYYPILDTVAWDTYQKRWSAYEEKCLNELRHSTESLQAQGITAEFTQTAGDPGRVICDLATTWEADLILVGHRGRTGLSEFLLGSVSNYVMHHAPCSVLVVNRPQASDTSEAEEAAVAAPVT
ncbi:MAG: universal stress protein [Cyanobacteria bacterium]|nr:universal stress protein [Cyanobacteriota bacterium]